MKALYATAIALGALLTGCADKSPTTVSPTQPHSNNGMIDTRSLPAWVLNPSIENGLGAVGIAKHSKDGLRVMLPKAEMDGRAKLASEVQTEISRLGKLALRQSDIGGADDFDEVFTQVTKSVVKKVPLSGAKRIGLYQEPNGDLFVYMVLMKRDIAPFMEEQEKQMRAAMARAWLDDSMRVMDKMMDELDKEVSR